MGKCNRCLDQYEFVSGRNFNIANYKGWEREGLTFRKGPVYVCPCVTKCLYTIGRFTIIIWFKDTSFVLRSNQWEMSFPAASIIGFNKTSPGNHKKLKSEHITYTWSIRFQDYISLLRWELLISGLACLEFRFPGKSYTSQLIWAFDLASDKDIFTDLHIFCTKE
jgi:hypothetical protein